jgi:hypothetical protein
MQDRYVGDVGDFGKYGLLRLLSGLDEEPSLRLGVVWYLYPDEGHNEDGKHVTYLQGKDGSFRNCDAPLYDQLRNLLLDETGMMVSSRRCLATIETSGLLSATTLFYSQPLAYSNGLPTSARFSLRNEWFANALTATASADLIFVDPDNGIECPSVSLTSSKGPKYVYWADIKAFAARGQSLVIYHHLNRSCSHPQQVEAKLQQLRAQATEGYEAFAVTFKRGTNRTYFILAAPHHKELLRERLTKMKASPWQKHFV